VAEAERVGREPPESERPETAEVER
jgi:hypothetical protein